ncbi:hypothetical protein SJ05684_c18840 [Sinorhizobium sojae CCBAU 05684]|uniref:Uncharacterized protein n=1 Tax=Sinorhizobium sojae CCBAU 05684 TaxID=716928 RepID=A0A249PBW7_9HYPH|nr:hypothetical protein SJ05684_c18840 [Sinorhizobium sojae CCBAU 05684]
MTGAGRRNTVLGRRLPGPAGSKRLGPLRYAAVKGGSR